MGSQTISNPITMLQELEDFLAANRINLIKALEVLGRPRSQVLQTRGDLEVKVKGSEDSLKDLQTRRRDQVLVTNHKVQDSEHSRKVEVSEPSRRALVLNHKEVAFHFRPVQTLSHKEEASDLNHKEEVLDLSHKGEVLELNPKALEPHLEVLVEVASDLSHQHLVLSLKL